ncbi:hypothetical protein BpHYR1_000989 [Brachionus plicatilis]|uniref:Uncharacterized protein n=1 Tax=Brachionus plicatilis TaxID=10195 RepID=A0A3M7QBD1_BRAPC|nr:hypothetical protein BpHYR1_000989 [Brachionus plicatilis]
MENYYWNYYHPFQWNNQVFWWRHLNWNQQSIQPQQKEDRKKAVKQCLKSYYYWSEDRQI